MVMETPSPQCVGREFVRVYYTMLHEAPEHLHRFYSHNSCFVHGGVERPGEEQPPVMGQSEIHQKVLSLTFQDCHAKIRQVDSQATVGNAVVVQVTGELSNNGQPMRRFMQTFILAPQSPKKYYVHNDIFRYQDEVFHDNYDTDTEREDDAGEFEDNVDSSSQPDDVHDAVGTSFEQPAQQEEPILSNGTAHIEETPEPQPKHEEPSEPLVVQNEIEVPREPTPEPEEQDQHIDSEPVKQSGPLSWAALAANSRNTGSSGNSQVVMNIPQTKSTGLKPEVKPNATSPEAPQPQRAPRAPRERQGAVRERGQGGSIGRDGDDDFRKPPPTRYPDTHQLFVGNVPLDATEKELRDFFDIYGNVVELRINTKGSDGKPNYGFIIFDNPESVQKVLKAKDSSGNRKFHFRKDHVLNVEVKKPRGNTGGRPGSGTRQNMRGGMGRGGSLGRGGRGGGPPPSGPRSDRDSRPSGGDRGGRGGYDRGPRR